MYWYAGLCILNLLLVALNLSVHDGSWLNLAAIAVNALAAGALGMLVLVMAGERR
jgi:hypothetical protein